MREYSTPLTVERPGHGQPDRRRRHQRPRARRRRRASAAAPAAAWADVTAAEFLDEVSAVAKGLIAAGIEAGDRVALISRTRYEWTLLDYAIWFAGAVTVPVYETSSAEQIEWILADSGARAVVAETPEHARPGRGGARRARRSCTTSGRSTDNAVGVLDPARRRRLRRRARGASYDARPRRPGHADLHLRHDRAAQGLHAHPRQLHVRARRRRRGARRAVRPATTAPRPCCSCRSPTSSPGSSRSAASRRGSGWATPPTSRTCSTTSPSSSRRSSSPCRGSSRRSSTPPPSAPSPTAAARSSTGPPTSAIAWSRGLDSGPARLGVRAQHARLRPAGLRQAARGARRPVRVRRLRRRAARRAARPLLPRHRRQRARGLRAHRDHRRADRQPARRAEGRHRRPAAAGHQRPRRRRRRAAVPRRPGLRRLLAQRRGDRRGHGRATAGSTPATSARSTTRASSGSPAARRRSW